MERNNLKSGLIVFLLLTASAFSRAGGIADTIPRDAIGIILCDFVSVYNDYLYVGREAISPGNAGFARIACGAAAVSAGFLLDDELREVYRKNHNDFSSKMYNTTNEFGNIIYPATLSGGIYLGGLIIGDESTRITGRLCFEALLLSGAITTISKASIGRSRPYLNEGNSKFRFLQFDYDHSSLPSGHSTVSFAMATVLSMRIDQWWAYAMLYPAASLTALARIYKDQHWFSDIITGALIGSISGWALCRAEISLHDSKQPGDEAGLMIIPTINGFCLSYSF